ncbi:hypothetical protein GH714_002448 [Hevea brasiliensis]|uniref:Beta-glucosidase n=1 Tax=Hevea brasiliensis TaxID=3981 RepID=A0A6A6KWY3_HEVBR|nr:hypothetical protein GH714_002448 [Hevea brasiliensis]
MLVFLINLLALTKPALMEDCDDYIPNDFNNNYFPKDFIFGIATSTYQEYIQNVKDMGFKAFRFSISWPRVIPTGRISEGVNNEGIEFYGKVIDEIKDKGLEPFVIIFHWDTPQALEDEYNGFLSSKIMWMDPITYVHYPRTVPDLVGDRLLNFIEDQVEKLRGSVDNVNLKGYFAWSYLDNFEWNLGYTSSFGLYHVNLDDMTRTRKHSAYWFEKFLNVQEKKIISITSRNYSRMVGKFQVM